MDALKLVFLLFLVGFAMLYGNAMHYLLETSWLLFAVIGISLPLLLAWIVGDENDRADFYKIRDWLTGKGAGKRTQKPPPERRELDD